VHTSKYLATVVATIVATLAVAGGVFALARTNETPSAGAASAAAAVPVKLTAFYLDFGGSESLGFQPTGISGHNGERTNTGYANDLLLREGLKGVALTLQQVGCPGDTVQSVLNTAKADACYQPPNTQLTTSVKFLQAHLTGQGLVTIDIGSNNIRPCLESDPVDQACVATALAAVQVDLPKILTQLKAAASSTTHFVGLEYSDPFLGYYIKGSDGPTRSAATLVAVDAFDNLLGKIYTQQGIATAAVPTFFDMNDATPTTVENVGTLPLNVEEACQLSWFCYGSPFGPDDHPSNAGYSTIAAAIEAVLPKSW
jgi:lysophospholipase L1-like esterase